MLFRTPEIRLVSLPLALSTAVLSALAAAPSRHPCTTYKPADIARAKQNITRHAWAKKVYARIKSRAARYSGMDRDRIRAFIPDQTPLITVKCPVCGNGPWSAYDLVDDGDALRCRACKTTWDFDPTDTSETWNVQSVLRTRRLSQVAYGCDALGLVYQLEGDRTCAEKAGVIAERMAEVFRGYRMNKVNANVWLEGPHPYYGKICGWKYREAGILKPVITGYDLIRKSGVLTPEQCARIDRDLITYTRDYFLDSFGEAGYLGTQTIQDQGFSYWCVAACAALLGDTQTLQSIVRMYEEMLSPESWIFYEDGTFFQGTWAYESQFLGGSWSIPEVIRGNLDVDIYANPKCRLMEKVLTWYLDGVFPDGAMPAVNDAHVGARPALLWSEIAYARYGNRKALRHLKQAWGDKLENGSEYSLFFRDPNAAASADPGEPYGVDSIHLPGMGMMILRQGASPSARTMAFLDYGPYLPSAHKQKDYMNFGLWACGMEMVSEIGYNHNPLWALRFQVRPIAHNTVLEVAGQEGKGKPLVWCITPGPKIAEAGLPPGNSRCIMLLPGRAGEAPLVVDLFRVRGERKTFTWTMHARSDDWQVKGVTGLAPIDVPKPLRNGRRGRAAGDIKAVWAFPGKTPRGLVMLMPAMGASEVTLAECPAEEDALQACHVGGGALKPGGVIPYRGHIQVTRSGPTAIFVALYAPFEGASARAVKAELHRVADRDDAVALRIDRGIDSFVVLHATRPGEIRFGATRLDGRICVVALRSGKLISLCLAGGTRAQHGEAALVRKTAGNAYAEQGEGGLKTVAVE